MGKDNAGQIAFLTHIYVFAAGKARRWKYRKSFSRKMYRDIRKEKEENYRKATVMHPEKKNSGVLVWTPLYYQRYGKLLTQIQDC